MARKKQPVDTSFVRFDVIYEDGTRSSNRKVPSTELEAGTDTKAAARAFIEAQDRAIAEKSGATRGRVKSIARSGK
jgi:hypothetical protein